MLPKFIPIIDFARAPDIVANFDAKLFCSSYFGINFEITVAYFTI